VTVSACCWRGNGQTMRAFTAGEMAKVLEKVT